ncbi:hypothetical protein HMPREF0731_1861 [Pseudoroseomonas cervicalis ATCC 49957]|uniref:Uncharacterized protein n=1 Tax=Pseudoroseomonas cervicalis ATCC 49957 TaxID=525371 RepID=D5RLA0_9PROT|nr:hypothetical protein HMPREF0731_1861 [Pseudoroseomonas cervicalis ATCC 49957]
MGSTSGPTGGCVAGSAGAVSGADGRGAERGVAWPGIVMIGRRLDRNPDAAQAVRLPHFLPGKRLFRAQPRRSA